MKTKSQCALCGLELSGNAKWRVEREMWQHIKEVHKAEWQKFKEEMSRIQRQIDQLVASMPSLYTTEQKGEVKRGSWIY